MADAEDNSDNSYKKDVRTVCKYGSQCYQKNKDHHEKYKHPQPTLLDTANATKTATKTTKATTKTTTGTPNITKLKPPPKKKIKLSESFKFKPLDFTFKKKVDTNTKEADKKPILAFKNAKEAANIVAAEKPTTSNTSLPPGDDVPLDKKITVPQTTTKDTSSQLTKRLGKIMDEEDFSPSPEDPKESIKQKFLVEMPDDFYSFWSFCMSLNSDKPDEALKVVGLYLVGPFDVLSGKLKNSRYRKPSLYLRHWRYYYDPPEFQTVIRGDDSKLFHMGYFRDDPDCAPCFVAGNSAATDCTITPLAENLFGAVHWFLQSAKQTCDPFKQTRVSQLQSSLQQWAKVHDFPLDKTTPATKTRARAVVAQTFHKAGIVVPYDKKTELGYRPLIETEANLRKMMKRVQDAKDDAILQEAFIDKLTPVITAAHIANDECDFGASLELGLDLFSSGVEVFHRACLGLLSTAYMLLGRKPFTTILEAHLQDRRKGASLSIIDL